MKKTELEEKVKKQDEEKKILFLTLNEIRQNARDCVSKQNGTHVNSVWLIEKVTIALTKVPT